MYTIQQENELIKLAKQGDSNACEKLWQAYAGLLHKTARQYQHTPSGRELAEDAPGIMALAFMEAIHAFDNGLGIHFAAFLQSRLRGAMYKAFKAACRYRQHTAHPDTAVTDVPWYNLLESPRPTPERVILAREELATLSRQLSAADKELLKLLYLQELPQTSIAQRLHLSPQTVSKRKQKLRTKIAHLQSYDIHASSVSVPGGCATNF